MHEPSSVEDNDPAPLRSVVTAAVVGGGMCLFAAIVGLTALGLHAAVPETRVAAITGLASVASTLAGGFAAWIGQRKRQ